MDDIEAAKIRQHIQKTIALPDNELIFIETLSPMGKDLKDQYIENMAFSSYNLKKDKGQATHYERQAEDVLRNWRSKIVNGAFMLYDAQNTAGRRMATLSDLQDMLMLINHQKYYYGLEQYKLNDTMYGQYQLANGALYGITQTLSGAYGNKVEKALDGAWGVEKYWEKPETQSLAIVHIKKKVDAIIQKGFQTGTGLVSMSEILDELEKAPFGFMPSSITALVLGFVMKEYVVPDYYWSNGSTSEVMTADKMKSMIGSALQQRVNPKNNYKEEFIRSVTPEVRSFLTCTGKAFQISTAYCGSVESARDQIRVKMKGFSFPIWCVKYILNDDSLSEDVKKTIDAYIGIANTANSNQDTENSLAEQIGKLVIEKPILSDDLAQLLTSENCQKGMLAYLKIYQDGLLPQLAGEIGDGGNYLNEVKKKFNADDANWVWNKSTVDEKISDVILDYKIVAESNKCLPKCSSLKETISAWNARTNHILIPCDAVMKHVGDLAPFLEQLKLIKQSGNIAEQNKQKFNDLLCTQREAFDAFYKNQVPYFIQDAEAFLSELDQQEISELYSNLPNGQFTKSKSEYYQFIQSRVDSFLKSQWKKKLQNLWYEKTGSKDPEKWSQDHKIPILCLFDEKERRTVKNVFRTIMSPNPSEQEAKYAMDYLVNADFYDKLSDTAFQDQCFVKRIIGNYAVLLQDVQAVKDTLILTIPESVYDWMDNSMVQAQLRKLADRQYKLTGCDRATEIIEKMDSDQLRRYLKARISDDVDFGIMILREE